MAFDNAKADETPFPPPDISSPNSSLANLSFISSISESNTNKKMEWNQNQDIYDGHNPYKIYIYIYILCFYMSRIHACIQHN